MAATEPTDIVELGVGDAQAGLGQRVIVDFISGRARP